MKATIKSTRTFGIEIEFKVARNLSITDVERQMNTRKVLNSCGADNYVRREDWNKTVKTWWKIVPDGSCEWELVSPILQGKEGINQARLLIDTLQSIEGVSVDVSCGVHVHVGSQDATPRKVANLLKYWAKNEGVVDSVLAPSRRNNRRWSKSLVDNRLGGQAPNLNHLQHYAKKIDDIVDGGGTINDLWNDVAYEDRYKSINLEAYIKYRTLEFRGHGASIDSEKITNWVIILTSLVDKTFAMRTVSSNLMNERRACKQIFGTTAGTLRFFRDRAENFGFEQFKNEEVRDVRWAEITDDMMLIQLSTGGFILRDIDTFNQMDVSVKKVVSTLLEERGCVRDWNTMNTRKVCKLMLEMEGTNTVVCSR